MHFMIAGAGPPDRKSSLMLLIFSTPLPKKRTRSKQKRSVALTLLQRLAKGSGTSDEKVKKVVSVVSGVDLD